MIDVMMQTPNAMPIVAAAVTCGSYASPKLSLIRQYSGPRTGTIDATTRYHTYQSGTHNIARM
jgi:hypothetical protein